MTTIQHTHDDWLITVQTNTTGTRGPWVAQAHQVGNIMVSVGTKYRYGTADDALAAVRDLIHLYECFQERWNDFFTTLAAGSFVLAMNGDFNLVPIHERLLDAVPSADAYQVLRNIAGYEPAGKLLTPEDLLSTILELQAMAAQAIPGFTESVTEEAV